MNKILHTYNNNLIFFIFAPTSNDLNSVRRIQSQIRRTVLKHRTRYTTHLPIIDDGQWTYIKLYRDRNNVNNTVEIRFDCTQQEWKEKNGKACGASNIFCCYLFVIFDFVFTCELVVDAVTPNWTAAGLEVLEDNGRARSAEDPLPFSRSFPPHDAVSQ